MLPLGLSYDHRVIDGAAAARFIVDLVQAFENFPEEAVNRSAWKSATTTFYGTHSILKSSWSAPAPAATPRRFMRRTWARRSFWSNATTRLGGVCLNRGCIPSKALLYAAHAITAARESEHRGISFGPPTIDVAKLRAWKDSILARLSGGVAQLAKLRGVQVLHGRGYFEDSRTLRVETEQGQQFIKYDQAIIAVGSKSAMPKAFDLGNPRIMTSTEALEVEDMPENLLVIGGGYIGMELGTVYATLGSKVVLVEALDTILAGADPDLARPVVAYAKKAFKEVRLKTKVGKMATSGKQIKVEFDLDGQKKEELYDRVLVAVGPLAQRRRHGPGEHQGLLRRQGFHPCQREAADHRPGHLCHRRHRRGRDAGPQGRQGSADRGGSHCRRGQRLCRMLPFRRLSSPTRRWRGAA